MSRIVMHYEGKQNSKADTKTQITMPVEILEAWEKYGHMKYMYSKGGEKYEVRYISRNLN
jgi:hypothetical protein